LALEPEPRSLALLEQIVARLTTEGFLGEERNERIEEAELQARLAVAALDDREEVLGRAEPHLRARLSQAATTLAEAIEQQRPVAPEIPSAQLVARGREEVRRAVEKMEEAQRQMRLTIAALDQDVWPVGLVGSGKEVRQVARSVEKMEKAQRLAIEKLHLYLEKKAALRDGDIVGLHMLRAREERMRQNLHLDEGRMRSSSLAIATLHYYHEAMGFAATTLAKITRVRR
jgi:hypothetical protein